MHDEAEFRRAYAAMHLRGGCDAPGGDEYRRVFLTWLAIGRPRPLATAIFTIANTMYDGAGIHEMN